MKWFLTAFLALMNVCFAETFITKSDQKVEISWHAENSLSSQEIEEVKRVFFEANTKSLLLNPLYDDLSKKRITALMNDYASQPFFPIFKEYPGEWVLVKFQDQIIGYAIFERANPELIYLAHGDVSFDFWGEGIEAHVIDLIAKNNPDVKKIYLIVSRARTQEYPSYEDLGFTASKLVNKDFSPYFFKSYEKTFL